MNLTKKNIQKTSGIHRLWKFYKPGQLVTIDRHVYRITKTNELLIGFSLKPISKHKG